MDFTASLESSSSLQVIFVNPAKPKTKRHFSIPQSEEQWQNCRCEYGLATVDSLINKVSNLRGWDQRHLQEWEKALKSKTLTRQDLDAFQQACHTRQSVPSLRFDSGGFQASQLPQESQALDHELGQALHIDKMFPADLNIAIAGYKVFDMSQELYQKASVAEKHQEICNRIERSNACITQYEWSDRFHLPAANQAIDDLVYNGVLRGSDVFRQKTYLKYCGHLKVENSSLQILIPTSPREILDVSLLSSEHNIDHKIPWRTDQVLLLGQGTILSTKGNIGFISIAMPLSSE
ncbi:hypothetical protein FPOAC1_012758 [Fusarium poae]|uniref:hypothetical protein n=1 Tax=Fusarium poae TaxID=36050 RepID=UPI001CE74F74|nr:hypothetical protein FPOAC1_012758 [Fusarium poae]KAG8667917.1 hypothetical protein FPOAC1_012758 [Fusarium poae]